MSPRLLLRLVDCSKLQESMATPEIVQMHPAGNMRYWIAEKFKYSSKKSIPLTAAPMIQKAW